MFNFQLFCEVNNQLAVGPRQQAVGGHGGQYLNICLVPEWRLWRWSTIRRWKMTGNPTTVYLPVFYLPVLGRSINWWFYYRALRQGVNGAAESILASWLYPDAVAVARVAQDIGAPVWLRVHGTDRYHLKNRHRRRLILEAVAYAQGVICNCQAVADDLVKWGISMDKIHIIPNGIDAGLFHYRSKEDALKRLGKEGAIAPNVSVAYSPSVLFIGNLVPIKGPDVLLRAFAALKRKQLSSDSPLGSPSTTTEQPKNSTTVLLIIGSGPMRAHLERLTRELGIADQVHFLGNRSHDEVALWMNVADVLCLTSRSEGMPNVVMEALVSGIPVVATSVGACPELLSHELTARLCKPDDSMDVAIRLHEVLEHDVDRESLACRHHHLNSWAHRAEDMLALVCKR